MRIALMLWAALVLVPGARAEAPEAAVRRGFQAFSQLAGWKLPERPPKRRVHLSGPARLQGSAYVPNAPSAYVTLSGTLELQGGGVSSGLVALTHADTFSLSGSFVSGWTRPMVYVSFYKDGRYAGGAWASGMVFVTGNYAHGWVSLSGTGTLEADVELAD